MYDPIRLLRGLFPPGARHTTYVRYDAVGKRQLSRWPPARMKLQKSYSGRTGLMISNEEKSYAARHTIFGERETEKTKRQRRIRARRRSLFRRSAHCIHRMLNIQFRTGKRRISEPNERKHCPRVHMQPRMPIMIFPCKFLEQFILAILISLPCIRNFRK